MTERMVYLLGGVPAARWVTRGRIVAGGILGLLLVAGLALMMTNRSPWTVLFVALVGVGIYAVMRRRTSQGQPWLSSFAALALRPWLARKGGWDTWDPSMASRPWWLSGALIAAVAAPSGDEIGLIDHAGAYTAVLEVEGTGEGLRSVIDHSRLEAEFTVLLRALAQRGVPVSQVDIITRAVPTQGLEHTAWVNDRLIADLPDDLVDSMGELTREAERLAEQLRTYVVLRMPFKLLADDALARGVTEFTPDTLPQHALATVSRVARLLMSHGMPVREALSPQQCAAVIRSMLCPSFAADDTEQTDDYWAAWPPFAPSGDHRAVVARGPSGDEWWHAVGEIPLDGWPTVPVLGRWLEPLVFQAGVLHRAICVSFRLLEPYTAAGLARSQMTTAESRRIHEVRTGTLSAGENEAAGMAAQAVAGDIIARGHAGLVPVVRVMISAATPQALARARETIEATVRQDLVCPRFTWNDRQHTVGLLRVLPLGMEVPA